MNAIIEERVKMVKAMEYVCRQINDAEVFEVWLMGGVADNDIEYGDLSFMGEPYEEDEAYWYAEDDNTFAELMGCFLRRMNAAYKSGGLYCGRVVSK